jgi:hypothetical protein
MTAWRAPRTGSAYLIWINAPKCADGVMIL